MLRDFGDFERSDSLSKNTVVPTQTVQIWRPRRHGSLMERPRRRVRRHRLRLTLRRAAPTNGLMVQVPYRIRRCWRSLSVRLAIRAAMALIDFGGAADDAERRLTR